MGYAWIPLLKDGRMIMNESQASVASSLPAGYLSGQDGATKVGEPRGAEGGRGEPRGAEGSRGLPSAPFDGVLP